MYKCIVIVGGRFTQRLVWGFFYLRKSFLVVPIPILFSRRTTFVVFAYGFPKRVERGSAAKIHISKPRYFVARSR